MKLAIMQPYLFPHLGYFQLIRAVDAFVVYDDVNYIKGGWINRNFILAKSGKQLITLALQGASPNQLINQIGVGGKPEKLLKTIRHCYTRAPQYSAVFPLLEEILMQRENNLAYFLDFSLRRICQYLGLNPEWYISSRLEKNNLLRGQDKILAICKELAATHYINAPGGKELYSQETFLQAGLQLSFIQSRSVEYRQFGKPYVPSLSIIDVMMFNDREQCARLMGEYDLV